MKDKTTLVKVREKIIRALALLEVAEARLVKLDQEQPGLAEEFAITIAQVEELRIRVVNAIGGLR